MTTCAYRSLEPVLQLRVAELRARRDRDATFVDAARRVARVRVGRAVGGGVGVAMALAAFAGGMLGVGSGGGEARGLATALLFLAWPVALVAAGLARLLARPLVARAGTVPMSGNPAVDLARLEATDPLACACETARAWERRSVAWPLAAVSLLAPLTIHGLVWFPLAQPPTLGAGMDDFGTWIGLSGIIVGHAHLALLVCAVRWACRLRTVDTLELRLGLGCGWGTALLVSAGVACLPGIVLLAIPPIVVLVTGLAFIPAMYHVTVRTLERERRVLEAA